MFVSQLMYCPAGCKARYILIDTNYPKKKKENEINLFNNDTVHKYKYIL